jgi:arginine utilization protein RocB
MIDKLNNNQIPEGALNTNRGVSGASHNVKPGAASQVNTQTNTDTTQDASLQVSFDSLIEQAKQAPSTDASAVTRAKELIASGQLDTPQNILQAVQNILKYGV